jgi:hypothetical protein
VCRSLFVTRVQRFAKLDNSTVTIACFTPNTSGFGVTWRSDTRPFPAG